MDFAFQLLELQPQSRDQRIRCALTACAGGGRLRLASGRTLGEDHRVRSGKVTGR